MAFLTLRPQWSNPANDVSGTCCIIATGLLQKQSARELLSAWCRVNVHDERVSLAPLENNKDDAAVEAIANENGGGQVDAVEQPRSDDGQKQMMDGVSLKGKTVILVHESAPSTLEGGDFRS
jgi:hypothetical protein